jgi:hypothetical protein
MVTQQQVQQGGPIVAQITAVQAVVGQLQAAITAGNWVLVGPIYLHDGSGNTVQVNVGTLSAVDTTALCQTALNECNANLAALQAALTGL